MTLRHHSDYYPNRSSTQIIEHIPLNNYEKEPKHNRIMTKVDWFELMVYHKLSVALALFLLLLGDYLQDGVIDGYGLGTWIYSSYTD